MLHPRIVYQFNKSFHFIFVKGSDVQKYIDKHVKFAIQTQSKVANYVKHVTSTTNEVDLSNLLSTTAT